MSGWADQFRRENGTYVEGESLFDKRPYIICEVGSNWRTLDDCLESIRVAKECGADAVKFQAFSREAMFGPDCAHEAVDGSVCCSCGEQVWINENSDGTWGPKYFRYGDGPNSLDLTWLPALKAKADEVGIDFACTAFSPELVAAVDPYVKWHKVASSDAAWPQMLEAVKATGKPVLLSTGAKTAEEFKRAVSMLPRCIPLDCVAAYPADFVNMNEYGKLSMGFSDHTLGYTATVEAARRGAVVIEKHFTAFPELDTPDRPHSLTPAQFTRMVKLIRGEPVESEETVMYLRANRRLVATTTLLAGTILKYGENYGAYRVLHDDNRGGASPFDWEKVEGKALKTGIGQGAVITLEDVE